jgi:ribosome-associated protein
MTNGSEVAVGHGGDDESEAVDPTSLAVVAARAADDKKGADTVVLQVGPVLGIAEFFMITAGANDRQVKAIAEEIEAQVAEVGGVRPINTEGLDTRQWVLLDYGDLVVHVFRSDVREFYSLDRLWADMQRIEWAVPVEGSA